VAMGHSLPRLVLLADAGMSRSGLAAPLQAHGAKSFLFHQLHRVLVATIDRTAPS
jgi:hypothetical protein